MRQEQEAELRAQIATGEKSPDAIADIPLPQIPYVSLILRSVSLRPG